MFLPFEKYTYDMHIHVYNESKSKDMSVFIHLKKQGYRMCEQNCSWNVLNHFVKKNNVVKDVIAL